MKNKIISVIIPIYIDKNIYLFNRLKNIILFFSKYNETIECIIVDSSTKNHNSKIKELCEKNSQRYLFLEQLDTYSAAKSRNAGSKLSSTEYLLFFDVDLIVTTNFIENLNENITNIENSNKSNFFIYPCLYLSEEFTKKIKYSILNEYDFNNIKERYLLGFNDEVLYLAVNTSTILVNKKHFFDIGAYDENFKGHGYEDFELIHRLFINYNKVEIDSDYIEDFKSNFPYKYKGFRKYYAFYSLPNFFENMYTLHLWHPRPLHKVYYKARNDNSLFFEKKLILSLKFDNINKIDNINPNTFKSFVNNLMKEHNYSNECYIGLNELNEYSKKNKKNSFKRKLRKLILNPIQFFKDMKK